MFPRESCRIATDAIAQMLEPRLSNWTSDRLLAEFGEYLFRDRGLAVRTVEDYRRVARSFLAARCSLANDDLDLGQLPTADVSAFMLEQSACRGMESLGNTITGLRALLRFLHLRRYTPLPLAAAVPAVATRRAEAPRTPSTGEVTRLLASCDRRTAIGRRVAQRPRGRSAPGRAAIDGVIRKRSGAIASGSSRPIADDGAATGGPRR